MSYEGKILGIAGVVIVAGILGWFAFWGSVAYVVVHFAHKAW